MSEQKDLTETAVQLAKSGNYQQAIELLQPIELPEHPGEVNYYLGLWHYKIGDPNKGQFYFQSSITDVTSPFAYRSIHNLASISKRHPDINEQVAGFRLLERALEMTTEQKRQDEQEQTVLKMARYILELDLFDSIDSSETGLKWVEFKRGLPSLDRKSKRTSDGLIALISALLNGYFLKNVDKMTQHLTVATQLFEAQPKMILLIANIQRDLITNAPIFYHHAVQKSSQEKEDLMRLVKVGVALNSVLDVDKLLELVVDNIIEISSAERGFLMLAENNELQFKIARDSNKNTLSSASFIVSQTVTEEVFDAGKPFLIADVERESSWILTRSVLDLKLKSILCVPLKTSEKTIGVIYVDNSIQSGEFSRRDLDMLTTLANQATIAIENARLVEDLNRFNQASSRFVPFEFLNIIQKHNILDVNLGDHTASEMTVMFTDIRSFTTISESMTPQENFDFVNDYLQRVSPVIRENQGFIIKYIGDGIMAAFPNNPDDAVQAGIAMLKAVNSFNEERRSSDQDPIQIGIGIHFGHMMVGLVGELNRMQGDAFSDHVNLASRLEGLNKLYGSSFIISQVALDKLKHRDHLHIRFLNKVQVKGKNIPVPIYEIMNGDPQLLLELKLKTLAEFESGLEQYLAKNFQSALSSFKNIMGVNPSDRGAQFFLERSNHMMKHGVQDGWDGTVIIDQ